VLRASLEQEGELSAFLMLIRVGGSDNPVSEGKLNQLRRRMEKSGTEFKSVEMLRGIQKGVWALFENILAVSWVVPAADHVASDRVNKDIESVVTALKAMPARYLGYGATWELQEICTLGGESARAG
jgi:adenylate cyclase